ncbi:sigma-70 family RNA polymerase sigma factor [Candidatus Poribacteria bacterium]|nr:sigma-70 family RNA polymerase sigma factor [Candidatus Poribacteria bacterium]
MSDESRSVDDEVSTLLMVHEPLLRHIISLNVDNPTDRDDVYQETVVAILEHFRKGKSVEHPKAWMVRIAKNKCADFHRRDKRDTNRDIDFGSIINHAAFGGGVSIADDQHQAVIVQEIHTVISERIRLDWILPVSKINLLITKRASLSEDLYPQICQKFHVKIIPL